jgi:5,5'-dehydrodivanillate O-demethylase
VLSAEANERLTRVGAGTPMGELLRRYWIPIRPTSQVVEESVLPIRVLGEDLVLFRTLTGEFGLVGERCAHRMTQLKYGYPDDHGLRCCYHGWMFGPSGQCLDMPLESAHSTLKDHVQIKAYPVQEMGGLVWAYLGPQPAPLLPPWDVFVIPNCIRQIGVMELPCNWLQAQENAGDPTHSAILHGHYFRYILTKKNHPEELKHGQEALTARTQLGIGMEKLWAKSTPYGMAKGIVYSQALGAPRDYVSEHSTVIFPFYTQTGHANQVRQELQIRVPIDDTHMYHINYACFLALNGVHAPKQEVIPWFRVPLYDDDGQPVLDNILSQDAHAWIAQGPILDRTKENLGRTDVPVTFLRKQFEEQLRIVENGGDPINIFRDPEQMPDILHGGHWQVSASAIESTSSSDSTGAYDRGYNLYEDANRFGPALPQIIEMVRKINERAVGPS